MLEMRSIYCMCNTAGVQTYSYLVYLHTLACLDVCGPAKSTAVCEVSGPDILNAGDGGSGGL